MIEFLIAAAPQGSGLMGFVPIIGMIAIFWFLLIRPQMKRQKEHQAKVAGLKKGDQVVTAGGLIGKVVKVDENYADIELAQGVRVKAVKATIGDIIPPGGTAAND
ncbi:preprotein translocase subunit YajC [Paraurantiacibacter namhicola]|uniref:Sec translocon accessory complex subunit YajC n=1 Tax=Paraurantiacibacter namhicola TaxID=645517 RepID=A0A1C7D9Y1_9SPHN|nr:preprotein translocase subunit YajC [Paraurantiacibacter namhicola]ANU08296.1 preprotein translocase subunit YajC [Paraurantiacibacter namhicola]